MSRLWANFKMKWEFPLARRGRRFRHRRVLKQNEAGHQTPELSARCGTHGHRRMESHKRIKSEQEQNKRNLGGNRPATSSKVSCFKCHEKGHATPNCPLLRKRNYNFNHVRRVDSCVVETLTCRLSHLSESFPIYLDTGAECSLIKESVASKFSGKRVTDIAVMREGNTCIKCTSQILSTICINGVTLEIIFHVLADSYLKKRYIMIGREILSLGFDVNITQDSLVICKTMIINACSKTAEDEIDINEVDTDIIGNDKSWLISVLDKLKNSFITNVIELKHIDPNVTVQRSPYSLSEEERRLVHGRISELITAKIIRFNNSPFASSMLLVKKEDGSDRLCIDFWEINTNTVADRYPLPLIAGQIARLQKARYFISLDMANEFHQIPIHPNFTEYSLCYPRWTIRVHNDAVWVEKCTIRLSEDHSHGLRRPRLFVCCCLLGRCSNYCDSIDQALARLDTVLDTLVNAGFSFNFLNALF